MVPWFDIVIDKNYALKLYIKLTNVEFLKEEGDHLHSFL